MNFKKKWSALYINLYIKIALHFKHDDQWILIVRDSEITYECCMF